MNNEQKSISLAKEWILNSGIQNLNSNGAFNGGFNSWFDVEKKRYPFIYSEITGYGLTTLLFLNSIFKNEISLSRAKLAAEWVISNAFHPSGGIKSRCYYEKSEEDEQYSFERGFLYSFDSAIVMNGLLNLYAAIKNPVYLKTAQKIADFLIDKMMTKKGVFYPLYDQLSQTTKSTYDKWSTQSGSFHSKIFIGLIKLSEITKEERYIEVVKKSQGTLLKFQRNDGRFITDEKDGSTNLHPHCYSIEGLLYAGVKLNDEKLIERLAKAVEWVFNNQLDDFSIPQLFSNRGSIKYERSDITAQVIRLGSFLIQNNYLDAGYMKNLDASKDRLLSLQNMNNEQRGGFFYGFDQNGIRLKHLNSWCTMFSIQALAFYHSLKSKQQISLNLVI
ncbi:MAG: glycoside hydrolase family 47 protein [Candidatus Aenigmarchaeota archaeon]|nr:glycoside hydrolase family 47 protein [Candidatus Aenigmarchaeota archaeon]